MIKFERITGGWTCIYENGVVLGDIQVEVDGYYYFYPVLIEGGCWPSHILKQICMKLEALNEAWNQKLKELDVKL